MSEELSKADAAKYLGVSVRALERYTQQARVGVRYVKGRAKPSPVYATSELDRFKAELARVVERPAVQVLEAAQDREGALQVLAGPGEGALQAAQVLAAHITAQVLEQVLTAQGATTRQDALEALADRVVLADKLLLTLAEAQVLTGLSRVVLRDAIGAGQLAARKIGRAWRVKRADLEAYVAQL